MFFCELVGGIAGGESLVGVLIGYGDSKQSLNTSTLLSY